MYVTGGVGFLNSLRVFGPKYRKSEGVIANKPMGRQQRGGIDHLPEDIKALLRACPHLPTIALYPPVSGGG